jgi:uncharacterized protein (DUF433 family)
MIVARRQLPYDAHYEPNFYRHGSRQRYYRYVKRHSPTAKDLSVPLSSAFQKAAQQVATISSDRTILGGTPCITGTRIPVYMILDALHFHGEVQGVLKSYPQLSLEQVRDAICFARHVLEAPVEDQAPRDHR